jgi:hypothetical protein
MPSPRRDVTGQRFGRLVITGDAPRRDKTKHRCVACQCDCGNTYIGRLGDLRAGRSQSCGCLQRENLQAQHESRQISLVGRRFGRLTAECQAPSHFVNGKWHAYWDCRCDCGNKVVVQRSGLTSGATKSCGCYQQEQQAVRARKHGASGAGRRWPEYLVWAAMLQRCNNPNNPAYHHYGGRGIFVQESWHDFTNFIADVGRRPSREFSLDRINPDGPYAKENCRWATRDVQTANRILVNRDEFMRLRAIVSRYQSLYGLLPDET